MTRREFVFFLALIFAAFACAAYALRPLVYNAEMIRRVSRETEKFYSAAEEALFEGLEHPQERPYNALYEAMAEHNELLHLNRQSELKSLEACEEEIFDLSGYGLDSKTFGVIEIPKMGVEMPLYLGASEENMAAGAAVLSYTSIPIGGENSNSVIAGHRGWSGYKYFKDIELLEYGDTVRITNLWETLEYEVREIEIIDPADVEAIHIQPGRDMLTLMTCHPYASGGRYRYLVYCERSTAA